MSIWEWLQIGGSYATEYAAVLILFGSAATFVAKGIGKALAPSKMRNESTEARLNKLEAHQEHVDECLDNDNKRLKTLDADSKLNLRINIQMLTHEIDGNHVDKLESLRDEATEYLIER